MARENNKRTTLYTKEPTAIQLHAEGNLFDRALEDRPPELRWREFMRRIEVVLFASSEPVSRAILARVIDNDCSIDLLVDDLIEDLHDRPYTVVAVAGGWQMRTRPAFGATIRAAQMPVRFSGPKLSEFEMMVLVTIAYQQPITRKALSTFFGREVSRDLIATLREAALIASGPRSPSPGAPLSLVTTAQFLAMFGLNSLRDLPEQEMMDEAGFVQGK